MKHERFPLLIAHACMIKLIAKGILFPNLRCRVLTQSAHGIPFFSLYSWRLISMSTVQDYLQNTAWVHRMEHLFKVLDTNKNGYITLKDVHLGADNFEKEVKPAAHLMAAVRARNEECYATIGVVPGKQTTKEEFLKGVATLAIAEKARKEKGEETLLDKVNNAWYDAVDTNHDGYVRLDEWRSVLRASNMEGAADEIFKALDKSKAGKIERKVLSDNDFKFWFVLDDSDTQGMFGDKFEKN